MEDGLMAELSPPAKAILAAAFAVEDEWDTIPMIAAALRAAADQSHPKAHIEDIDYVHQSYVDGWKDALDVILAVADELEAQ